MRTYLDWQAPDRQHNDLERLARRRAAAKLGFFTHALVFIAVNTMLILLAAMGDRNWAVYPAFGWGLGLAIHGAAVFLWTGGGGLQDRLIAAERNRLSGKRDPW